MLFPRIKSLIFCKYNLQSSFICRNQNVLEGDGDRVEGDGDCEGRPVEEDLGLSDDSLNCADRFIMGYVLGKPGTVVDYGDWKSEKRWVRSTSFS